MAIFNSKLVVVTRAGELLYQKVINPVTVLPASPKESLPELLSVKGHLVGKVTFFSTVRHFLCSWL
jgi:hypothetical protein